MKNLLPGIWQWSWFSQEKQLDFNGLFLTVGEHKILVDPPPMTGEASSVILRHGPVDYIILTNRDHVREAIKYQEEFRCQLHVPEADAPQMDLKATKTFKDGELLVGHALTFSPEKPGFFVIPSDPAGNNLRVYVPRSAIQQAKLGPAAEQLALTAPKPKPNPKYKPPTAA